MTAVGRTGGDLHQRVGLDGDGRDAVAEGVQLSLTGGAGFGGKGQILDGFDGLIVGGLISRDDHDLRVVAVGVGARHGACDLGRERHAVPDAVDGLAVELQNLVVPDDLDEFHLDAEGLGKGLGQIGVEADPFAGFVLIVHRGKIGNADDERSLVLNVGKIGFGSLGGRRPPWTEPSAQPAAERSSFSFFVPPESLRSGSGLFIVLIIYHTDSLM